MKYIIKIFLASLVSILTLNTYAAPLHEGVVWLSYNGDAFVNSKKISSPVLLFVSASWCNNCQEMLKNTLRDPKVAQYIKNNFITVFANTDELTVLERYHITELPALLVLNSYGDVIDQFTGFRDSDATMKVLMKARGKVTSQPLSSNVSPHKHNNIENMIGKHVLSLNHNKKNVVAVKKIMKHVVSKKSAKQIAAKKTKNTKHVAALN